MNTELPIISREDLRNVLPDVLDLNATREDLRDFRRILANLSGDVVRDELDAAVRSILRQMHDES